ncbi:out at first protein isoform X1 [Onthophagus taurus]|uniref:out at first protein isoform X1 n=1 Tax=Onthophagus taurus TaxID=166361 RepID=UPI0039BE00E0
MTALSLVFSSRSCTLIVLLSLCVISDTQLVINVRNQGGDVVQETIAANVSFDTVSLEFQRSDGTLVTQLIDFRNEVQILKALVLGEEERGQSQYQVMCFIFHTPRDAFIPSDAMSKLRQKNPGTIRVPEDDKGRTNYSMDYTVILKRSTVISPHIAEMCAEAPESSYTRHEDIKTWSSIQGVPESVYITALKKFPTLSSTPEDKENHQQLQSCTDLKNVWSPCQCHLELCVGWYPCGLKYCKGKGENKGPMTYRCGIKTCRKCSLFSYYVPQKQLCLWDE